MKGGNTGSEIWVSRECSWEVYLTAGTQPGLPLESLGMQPEPPGDGQLNSIKEGDVQEVDCTNLPIRGTLWDISHHWKDATLEAIQT